MKKNLRQSSLDAALFDASAEACGSSSWELALALVALGANPLASPPAPLFRWWRPPIELAILENDEDVLRAMLASIPTPSPACGQAYLLALRERHPRLAEILLGHGADPFFVGSDGFDGGPPLDALHHALRGRCLASCKLAILHGIDPASKSASPCYLETAINAGFAEGFELIRPAIAPFSTSRQAYLFALAMRSDSSSIVASLLSPELNLSPIFSSVARSLESRCHGATMDLILESLDPSLLDHSPAPGVFGEPIMTPLMSIVSLSLSYDSKAQAIGLMRRLLPFSDPQALDELGRDALMVGLDAAHQNAELILPLIPWADLSHVDLFGETALDKAARWRSAELANALLSRGALHGQGSRSIHDPSPAAAFALDWHASSARNIKAIQLWLFRGADPHLKSQSLAAQRRESPVFNCAENMGSDVADAAGVDSPLRILTECLRVHPGPSFAATEALDFAISRDSLVCAMALIDGGAAPLSSQTNYCARLGILKPLAAAVAFGRWPVLEKLLVPERAFKRNERGLSPLDLALSLDNAMAMPLLQCFLRHGWLRLLDGAGWTSLAHAAPSSPACLDLLLSQLDPDSLRAFIAAASAASPSGHNALSLAAKAGRGDSLALLAGAGIRAQPDILGQDLLMLSIRHASLSAAPASPRRQPFSSKKPTFALATA